MNTRKPFNEKGHKLCQRCKDYFDESHFLPFKRGDSQILLCKKHAESKPKTVKKKTCHVCGGKSYPLDHFVEFITKNGYKRLACKITLEKNGGTLHFAKGHKIGAKLNRVRKNYLEYELYSDEWYRERHYQKEYGISLKDYNEMSLLQNNLCAICNKIQIGKALAIDHNHDDGNIRGLLCENCNKGLGLFNDNVNLISKAIEYLLNSKYIERIESKKYSPTEKAYFKDKQLKRDFGISLEDYNKIFLLQNECCAICNNHQEKCKTFQVDHDHENGEIRGLLCNRCNTGIGQLKDSIELLKSAIKYLNKWDTINIQI